MNLKTLLKEKYLPYSPKADFAIHNDTEFCIITQDENLEYYILTILKKKDFTEEILNIIGDNDIISIDLGNVADIFCVQVEMMTKNIEKHIPLLRKNSEYKDGLNVQ